MTSTYCLIFWQLVGEENVGSNHLNTKLNDQFLYEMQHWAEMD